MSDKSEDHSKMSYRLGQAIYNGELEHVRMYIEEGADLNRQCYSGKKGERYPLALACLRGHEEVIQELLSAGADPNQVSGDCPKPAMFLAAKCPVSVLTLSMIRCFISYGANVTRRDYFFHTENILHILARGEINDTDDNILSAVKIVLENGASFYAQDRGHCTPLYEACKCGNIDLVKLFIAEGADVNFDIGNKTMLTGAADGCNIEMFNMLLKAGADRRLTPDALIEPCEGNDHAMIEKIMDTCDVDINMPIQFLDGKTILHYACRQCDGTSETVQLLLDRGADVRAKCDTENTALHYAVELCDCNKIRQLLSYDTPLNIKNDQFMAPLEELSRALIFHFLRSRQQAHDWRIHVAMYQAGVLAFKMPVTAGAKITTYIEHRFNESRLNHPDAQLPDYEISSTRSLKEICRLVIRVAIRVPVDASLSKLPIPKLLQDYLNFPEFDPLVVECVTQLASLSPFEVELGKCPITSDRSPLY